MFTKQEIKYNIIGCLEIILFMRSGIERFQSVSRASAIKSFIIPVMFLPLVLSVMVLTSSEGYSIPYIVMVHSARMVATTTLYLTIIYFLCKQLKRNQYFCRYLVISNWISLFDVILVSPILFYLFTGTDVSVFGVYATFITLLNKVYSAFIMTVTFRIPWELGGFFAIVGLAVGETMWDVLFFFAGNIAELRGD